MQDSPSNDISSIESAAPLAQPQLDAIQARVLGCLIEKAAITPDVYPLTVNSALAACNQKTSREPVMNLEFGTVGHTLRTLTDMGLAKLDPLSLRADRYSHLFDTVYGVTPRQRAVLCVMLLRGPQTLNELLTRCERLTDFPSVEDVRDTLERLIDRTPALVVRLPRGGGRREDRYMHLLCGEVAAEAYLESVSAAPSATRGGGDHALEERIVRLEADLAQLREQVTMLLGRVS